MLQVNPKWMVFFFSLTSELKNQLFTQLLFKMAWNHLIVHVGSYLLCDLITALLILALFLPGFVVFCSKSNHRLLQSDILPSWHLRYVCRAIIPTPVVHKQHRAVSFTCPSVLASIWMPSLSLQVTSPVHRIHGLLFSPVINNSVLQINNLTFPIWPVHCHLNWKPNQGRKHNRNFSNVHSRGRAKCLISKLKSRWEAANDWEVWKSFISTCSPMLAKQE